MLLDPTIIKKIPRRWLLVGVAVLLLAISSYLLARPLMVRSLWSKNRHQVRPGHSSGSPEAHAPVLHITAVTQHGHIVEIEGTTEPGTIVMINGQAAATIFAGNAFRHFVGPLPAGTTMIAVTCQNENGGVNTQQLAVTID
jgi:hypothetical protein